MVSKRKVKLSMCNNHNDVSDTLNDVQTFIFTSRHNAISFLDYCKICYFSYIKSETYALGLIVLLFYKVRSKDYIQFG